MADRCTEKREEWGGGGVKYQLHHSKVFIQMSLPLQSLPKTLLSNHQLLLPTPGLLTPLCLIFLQSFLTMDVL
jgi:hypothetical protein